MTSDPCLALSCLPRSASYTWSVPWGDSPTSGSPHTELPSPVSVPLLVLESVCWGRCPACAASAGRGCWEVGRLRNVLAPGHSWAESGLTNEVTHLSSLRAWRSLPVSSLPSLKELGPPEAPWQDSPMDSTSYCILHAFSMATLGHCTNTCAPCCCI